LLRHTPPRHCLFLRCQPYFIAHANSHYRVTATITTATPPRCRCRRHTPYLLFGAIIYLWRH
jgi:hypothetical protein